jgi:hypothetical protein
MGFGPPPVVPFRPPPQRQEPTHVTRPTPSPVTQPPPPQPVYRPTPPPAVVPSPTFREQIVVEKPQVFQPVDVTIEIPVPPEFIQPLKNLSAQEGTRVTFEGCVGGRPEPTIKWFKEGRLLSGSADYEISYQQGRVRLVIPETFESDSGRYQCTAQNKAGQVSSTAELVVKGNNFLLKKNNLPLRR